MPSLSKKKAKQGKRLVLIDANAIIHRAFHALPPLTSPAGESTNAVYGFTTILLRIIREMKPDYIAAAFDTPKPTFRHIAYKEYKATRVKAPDELYMQIPRVKELIEVFGIKTFEKEGFEADDVIGTIAAKTKKENPETEIVIVTGDMDTLQLVDDKTKVWTMRKGVSDTILYDEKAVRERFGINPESLPDYKGLRGDPSDNIPGVKGVGEKTASDLLSSYGNLEKLYAALEKGSIVAGEAVKEKLRNSRKDAFFSRELGTIKKDTPIEFKLEGLSIQRSTDRAVEDIFRRLGFFSLLKRLKEAEIGVSGKKSIAKSHQGSLFVSEKLPGVSAFKKAVEKRVESAAVSFEEGERRLVILLPGPKSFVLNERDFDDKHVRRFFESEAIKYIFDAKSLYKELFLRNVKAQGFFDFLLAAYILDPGKSEYSIDDLLVGELNAEPTGVDGLRKIEAFFGLGQKIKTRLRNEELWSVFENIEKPLTPVLAEMELLGIKLDREALRSIAKKIDFEITSLTKDIYREAGIEFNIASPRQVSEVIFQKIGVSSKGVRKTGGGKISTRFSELSKLIGRHPIVEKILRHRELAKLKTTYIDTLPTFLGKDGRLHTTFNQTRTETGRLASENPNLQNIPIKTEFGRWVRRAFVADHGWTLVSFDYSQVELRIAADLAGDDKMIDAFKRGVDIHALTAAEVNNVPVEKVTPELRRKAKALNFGVLYGMGPRGFAESAGISTEEAEIFIAEYFSDFKGIAEFVEKTKEFAREHGFVKTAFGRKRYLPGIISEHPMIRSEAERMAVNMPIQGTATGDIMKLAMIEVQSILSKEFYGKARMLLQIHDELLCELEDGATERVIPKIKSAMEGVWRGKVSLKVDVKKGKNWAELN